MNRHVRPALRTTAGFLAGAGVLLASAPAALAESTPAPATPSKIELMLDASGSMNAKDPSGLTKIAAAKKALAGAVNALPADAQVGLRVYGATQPGGKPTPAACADTQLVHPIGPLDKAALTTAITGFNAKGETPIAFSLGEAAKDLGADGKRHIILVSDGEESCVPDPCPEVKKIVGQGIDLQIDTVGFGVTDKARQQLACIADAGHGTYYDAKDAPALESSLKTLSTRATRPFTVQGTPVVGTPKPEGAPLLEVGQYTDTVGSSGQGMTDRYYRVHRAIPNSTLRVSMVGRMPQQGLWEGLEAAGWSYELTTPDGTVCSHVWDNGQAGPKMGAIATGTTVALPLDPKATQPETKAKTCAEATEFVYHVQRAKGTGGDTATEIRVLEEAPASNAATLPAGVASVPKDARPGPKSPAQGTPAPVVGGASFNDALSLKPGTYITEVVPGELVLFKTPLTWGQKATFAIDGPDNSFQGASTLGISDTINVTGNVYAPDFSQMDSQELMHYAIYYWRSGKFEVSGTPDINEVPTINYRNRWDSPAMHFDNSRGFAMAGDYYFGVGVPQSVDALKGVPVPVRFSIGVDGQPTGQPEFAAGAASSVPGATSSPSAAEPATATPVPSPATATSSSTTSAPASTSATSPAAPSTAVAQPGTGSADSTLPLIGGGLVGVAALGAIGYGIARGRH